MKNIITVLFVLFAISGMATATALNMKSLGTQAMEPQESQSPLLPLPAQFTQPGTFLDIEPGKPMTIDPITYSRIIEAGGTEEYMKLYNAQQAALGLQPASTTPPKRVSKTFVPLNVTILPSGKATLANSKMLIVQTSTKFSHNTRS